MGYLRSIICSLGLLLCFGRASHAVRPYFLSHMLNHPKNPYNAFQAYFEKLLPQYNNFRPATSAETSQEEVCGPQVQTIRAMTELHWMFNDFNLDGVMDTTDVLWDLTLYNRPSGDVCTVDVEEFVKHADCVYSYPRDFATAIFRRGDPDNDGLGQWFDWVNRTINYNKADFLRNDYNAIKGFCVSTNYTGTMCNQLKIEPVPDYMS